MTTVTSLATAVSATANASTIAITTSVAVAAGESIVIAICSNAGNRTVSSISDGTANVYSKADGGIVTSADAEIWHCLNPVAVASASTITVTLSGANTTRALGAFKLDGTATLVDHGNGAANSASASASTAGSVASGVAVIGAVASVSTTVPTQPGGIWTSDFDATVGIGSSAIAHGNTSGAGVATYAVTVGSNNWADVIAAYSVPSGGPLTFGGELVHGSLIRGGRLAA